MEFQASFPPAPAAIAHARGAVDRALGPALPVWAANDLRLIVSELVTNVVRHAGLASDQELEVRGTLADDRVRVEVSDPGKGFEPKIMSPSPDRASGWGLHILDQLANRWGTIRNEPNIVWFELDLAGDGHEGRQSSRSVN
jgi:anti-sigma regulatory factor (Ser/Thr protein kinase)